MHSHMRTPQRQLQPFTTSLPTAPKPKKHTRGYLQTCSVARSSAGRATVAASGKDVVVIGGGWAGFGAAKHLSEQGYHVTLLEASTNPGGLSGGFRTKSGKVVEAGMKGFWYQVGE
eukprot:jgi/Chrzof1/13716/Cz08g09100.t1